MGNRAKEDLEPCGTPAAYKRHLRHGEDPCRLCKAAEARRWKDGGAGPRRYERWRIRYAEARAAGLSRHQATRYSHNSLPSPDMIKPRPVQ